MTKWTDHVKSVASKKGISYGKALSVASASWKGQTKKDKKDESKKKGSKSITHKGDLDYTAKKGSKSKTHKGDKDFTTKKGDKDYHRGGKTIKEKKTPY